MFGRFMGIIPTKARGGSAQMNTVKELGQMLIAQEEGAVLVEYVLLIVLIAIVALVGIKTFGGEVANKMANNNNSVANAIQ